MMSADARSLEFTLFIKTTDSLLNHHFLVLLINFVSVLLAWLTKKGREREARLKITIHIFKFVLTFLPSLSIILLTRNWTEKCDNHVIISFYFREIFQSERNVEQISALQTTTTAGNCTQKFMSSHLFILAALSWLHFFSQFQYIFEHVI